MRTMKPRPLAKTMPEDAYDHVRIRGEIGLHRVPRKPPAQAFTDGRELVADYLEELAREARKNGVRWMEWRRNLHRHPCDPGHITGSDTHLYGAIVGVGEIDISVNRRGR